MKEEYMSYFMNLLPTVYMMSGYTTLLSVKMKLRNYTTLFLYFFFLYNFVQPHIGQYGTIFIILGGSIIIYFGCNKSILDVILALTGHLIVILTNHLCSIPLSLLGFPLVHLMKNHEIPMALTFIFSATLLLFAIRKFFLLPRLPILQTCPPKLLRLFLAELLIGLTLLATNFIYGETVAYPTKVLSMNGFIITILTLSAVLIFYGMYDILMKNHELTLQQAQAEIMQDYTNRMESFYDEIRIFRHDYRNILATMQHYIDSGNVEALQKYYHDKILADTEILSDDGFFLGKLHLIEDPAVKSLLYTKLITILNQNLSLTLELVEPIPVVPIDNLTLCRILGIFLDNAIEASVESPEKTIHLAFIVKGSSLIFIIENSTLPIDVPIEHLSDKRYSTKPNHDGQGLATVAKLLDPLPHVSLFTEYQDKTFRQTLQIRKDEHE